MRIILTGGGTGGHIFPLIAVIRELGKLAKKEQFKLEAFYIGPDGFSRNIMINERVKTKIIWTGKLRRYFTLNTFLDFLKFPLGFFQALWSLFWFMPDVIFSKGGYGSFWVVFIGWLFRIPVVVHESDSIPGLANRILAPFTKKIALSFNFAKNFFPASKIIITGNPIRKELLDGTEEGARKIFGLQSEKSVILIIGGSQGAQAINNLVFNILPQLVDGYEVIHQCGSKNFEDIKKETSIRLKKHELPFYHLFPFLDENQLKHAYKAADLIVSRAGAGSIFEIASLGKPSIIVPLPTAASDHQRKNAFIYTKEGGGEILEEPNLTPHLFLEKVNSILGNDKKLYEMKEKTKSFAKPEAAEIIAKEIIKLAKQA